MINSKKMVMEQLDCVAGGTYTQSMEIANFLEKAGYKGLYKGGKVDFTVLRNVVSSLGFDCHDHGGIFHSNTYTNKVTGTEYTHEEFKFALKYKFPNVG